MYNYNLIFVYLSKNHQVNQCKNQIKPHGFYGFQIQLLLKLTSIRGRYNFVISACSINHSRPIKITKNRQERSFCFKVLLIKWKWKHTKCVLTRVSRVCKKIMNGVQFNYNIQRMSIIVRAQYNIFHPEKVYYLCDINIWTSL